MFISGWKDCWVSGATMGSDLVFPEQFQPFEVGLDHRTVTVEVVITQPDLAEREDDL